MRKHSAGKGDRARPCNKGRYDAGYERAFGKGCSICKGKGFHWDEDGSGKTVKTTCLVCNGTGKETKGTL
jgi:hypothetical protein